MKTIFKYILPSTFLTEFKLPDLPQDAKILYVGLDPQDRPSLWAELHTEWISQPIQFERPRLFVATGTGHEVPPAATYLGTWRDCTSTFIWHLHETTRRQ